MRRVSPVQSAPAETPQSRKAARVGGCSGVTQVAYPLFFELNEGKSFKKSVAQIKIIAFLCRAEIEKQCCSLKKLKYIKAGLAQLARARDL